MLEDAVKRKSTGDVSVAYERAADFVANSGFATRDSLATSIRALAKEPNGE